MSTSLSSSSFLEAHHPCRTWLAALVLLSGGCLSGSDPGLSPDAGDPAADASAGVWDGGLTLDGEVRPEPDGRDDEALARDAGAPRPEDATIPDARAMEDANVKEDDASAREDAGREISCAGRKGGALIGIYVGGEDMTFHATDQGFISDAFLACATGTLVTIHFRDLLDGADCDGRFSWHPHPEHMVVSEHGDESCDATLSEVEADKESWVEPMTPYCPTQVLVTSVQPLAD